MFTKFCFNSSGITAKAIINPVVLCEFCRCHFFVPSVLGQIYPNGNYSIYLLVLFSMLFFIFLKSLFGGGKKVHPLYLFKELYVTIQFYRKLWS